LIADAFARWYNLTRRSVGAGRFEWLALLNTASASRSDLFQFNRLPAGEWREAPHLVVREGQAWAGSGQRHQARC
jgi:hypothetical protein